MKLGGFSAPTQDVSGAFGSARNDTMTAWAQGDSGETKCPMPGMLMMVALDRLRRRGLRPGKRRQRIEAARDEERRDAARDGLAHGLRGGGDLPDVAAVLVEIRPAADALALHRGRIVRKRFPAGRGEILRRRERVVFATADAIGQPVAEGRDIRTGWRRPACPILGDRLDGIGAAGGEPIDPIRRGSEQGHGIVLVAQPVDQCPAVEDDFEVFAGGRVAERLSSAARPRAC